MTDTDTDTDQAALAKACCASAYSSDIVALLLGESYHPGGLTLTRRLGGATGLRAGDRVLDVAAGRGASATVLARDFGCRVEGIDLSDANVAIATASVPDDLTDRVVFSVADAERLPHPDGVFDAVVCECAFCTFPDKLTAAAELARVLRPGGRAGITDVTADHSRLPPELTSLAAWVACIADARPLAQYQQILAAAGLRTIHTEHHDEAMTSMIDQIEARLTLVRMTAYDQAAALGVDFDRAGPILTAVRQAVADGVLGYALLVAERT